jgi:hypothetical protein
MLWDEKIIEQLVEHPTMTSKVERENQMHTFGATSLRVWNLALVSVHEFGFGGQYLWYFRCETHNKFRDLLLKDVHQGLSHFHAIHIGGDSGMANSVHGFGKDRSFGK